jgi:hypothetical protein
MSPFPDKVVVVEVDPFGQKALGRPNTYDKQYPHNYIEYILYPWDIPESIYNLIENSLLLLHFFYLIG